MKKMTAREKAHQIAKSLRGQDVGYDYIRNMFVYLRKELGIDGNRKRKSVRPYIPTEEEMEKYYKVVWECKNMNDVLIIKTLLYTGIKVSELIRLKIRDVHLDGCSIEIKNRDPSRTRRVPFPSSFKELLGLYIVKSGRNEDSSLFQSRHGSAYSDRGIRRILEKYSLLAGMEKNISPHKLRHFLLSWLKNAGIEDSMIKPYSGHVKVESMRVYDDDVFSKAQAYYNEKISGFPI